MIYIDPPYNTRSESFVYKDNFKVSDAGLVARYGLNAEAVDFLHDVYGTRSHSGWLSFCLLYTSPSPRDATLSRMPSSA